MGEWNQKVLVFACVLVVRVSPLMVLRAFPPSIPEVGWGVLK